ncbi:Cytochrome P450 family protein [Ceratobasidium theobromae]|uniref:Cytochrome P450 family protein n=1 Tax=Ceratobasidium theobromae TaxID=1582974 RepID=A0A5N5QFN4_9AGAM|nr:Cytochrome P450 family protein [Ceratobasidium theobromae]
MSNSTVISLASIFGSTFDAEGSSIDPSLLVYARAHPFHIALGVLGALGIRTIYKHIKRATAFGSLDGPTASSFISGHEGVLFNFEHGLETYDYLLDTYGAVCRVKGMLGEDRLWVSDPRALHDIVVKGYDDFREPESFLAWFKLSSGPNILTTIGHKHKIQRKSISTPCQTPAMTAVVHHLEDIFTSKVQSSGGDTGVIDIYEWMSNVGLEVIGQAGMGYSFGTMEEKESDYLNKSRDLIRLMNEMWYIRPFLPSLMKLGPARFRRFVINLLPLTGPARAFKQVVEVMDGTAVEIYQRKKRALEDGTLDAEITAGNDIMSSLLRQNQIVSPSEQMSEEEVISQVSALVFAGHDTTSALARTLYLLAQNQDVQAQLHAEVRGAHRVHGKNLDYDQLNSLSFLDAVCRESLRLHSPAQVLERVAHKDWNLPLQYPVKSKDEKSMISSILVEKGTHIYISLGSANRDKQTWGEDADQFKPSRWLQELPPSVVGANMPGIYSSTMTFLGGPRACLGFKFSQLEMKMVLSNLISSFSFALTEDEITWATSGTVKPHIRRGDGSIDIVPTLPMKVTVIEDSD